MGTAAGAETGAGAELEALEQNGLLFENDET